MKTRFNFIIPFGKDLRNFMIDNFGFGDFKFRLPNGKILDRATSVKDLYECIKKVSAESLQYHSSNNHISNWLASRGEFILSSKFRKLKINDFKSVEKRRKHHLKIIDRETMKHGESKIVEFSEIDLLPIMLWDFFLLISSTGTVFIFIPTFS